MSDIRPNDIKPCWSCDKCVLRKFARKPVWGRGPKKPLFVMVGEGPGREEDASGIPFHPDAPAGGLLTDILRELGIKRSQVYFTNATRCFKGFPSNGGGDIPIEAIKSCRPYLTDEIDKIDCEYVVLAGNEALKSVLGHQGITKEHGLLRVGPGGKKYFPILHPASALPSRTPENRNKIRDALRDLQRKIEGTDSSSLSGYGMKIVMNGKMLGELEHKLKSLPEGTVVAGDFETNSLKSPFQNPEFIISGMSFVWKEDSGWYLPIDHKNPQNILSGSNYERAKDLIRWYVKTTKLRKLNHNLKYEYLVAAGALSTKYRRMYSDTMLMSHLIRPEPGTHGLKKLAWQVGMGGYDMPLEQWFEKTPEEKRDYTKVPVNILGSYAIADGICTLKYHNKMLPVLKKRNQVSFYVNRVVAAIGPYAEMEIAGILVDQDYIVKLDRYYTDQQKKQRSDMRKLLKLDGVEKLPEDFNFDSPEQSASLIQKWFGLDELLKKQVTREERRKKFNIRRDRDSVSTDPADYVEFNKAKNGKRLVSTSKASLKGLLAFYPMNENQRSFINIFREYRSGRKRFTSNVKGLTKHICADGRVRSSLLLHGTVTSRRSSRDPNQQNYPRDAIVKRVFVAKIGYLLVCNDYKNLEVRIAAAKSNDKALLAAFNSGKDVHSYLGSKAYHIDYDDMMCILSMPWDKVRGDVKLRRKYDSFSTYRSRAKILWWVMLFGGGPDRVADAAGIPYTEAIRLQEVVYDEFPRLKDMFDSFTEFAEDHGYARTDYGRRRYLDGITSTDDSMYHEARRQGLNTPIQGTAADVTLRAVTLLHREWSKSGIRARNIQEVHDAVSVEAHRENVHHVIVKSKEIMESITCPSSAGKIVFEVDTMIGCHLGSKLKVTDEIIEMARKDPNGLYEMCRRDLKHPPEYYV